MKMVYSRNNTISKCFLTFINIRERITKTTIITENQFSIYLVKIRRIAKYLITISF